MECREARQIQMTPWWISSYRYDIIGVYSYLIGGAARPVKLSTVFVLKRTNSSPDEKRPICSYREWLFFFLFEPKRSLWDLSDTNAL